LRRLSVARPFIGRIAAAKTSGKALAESSMPRALTIQPSNHSFIQLFELQLPTPPVIPGQPIRG
ncbi:MAG: hypothetical protein ACRD9W_11790, partial [Terriglobia bacterium]